ncbi:MAG: filamentous hemagglutinin N-terminal domain-containing protein [Candidatus Symbiobacter sp.]|nr:filamentous hemagglutinin N-terminal domain-containing protein [Candidatus Symbiobacter sp.]
MSREIFIQTDDDDSIIKLKIQPRYPLARNLWAGAALAALLHLTLGRDPAAATPTGGKVVQGAATILAVGDSRNFSTTITQTTPRAVINWAGFDVGTREDVTFNLPAKAATLNIIQGGQSKISGQVKSNGTLYFVNQNGFVFGPQSSLTAQNLVISSQMIDAGGFIANRNQPVQKFEALVNPAAMISLKGAIEIQDRGVVAVFAPHIEVAETALILVRQGTILLAGGAVTKLDCAGDGVIHFDQSERAEAITVKNNGTLTANGGRVVLTAKGGKNRLNARVENNGALDTSLVTPSGLGSVASGLGEAAAITITVENGTASLGRAGNVNVGEGGTFTYHQNNPHDDIVVDKDFLHQINYLPSLDLDLGSGRQVMTTTPILGDSNRHINIQATGGIILTAAINIGGLNLNAGYVQIYHHVTVDKGGLNITSNGLAPGSQAGIMLKTVKVAGELPYNATNGGNMIFTAYNGGQIYVGNPIAANNIVMTSHGGGIGLYDRVTASNTSGKNSYVTLIQYNRGDIWVDASINTNNLTLSADNGSINVVGKVTASNPDINLGSNGNITVAVKTGIRDIEFHEDVIATKLSFHADRGSIKFDKNIISEDASHLPQELVMHSQGDLGLANVGVRPGGVFDLSARRIGFTSIMADNAKRVSYSYSQAEKYGSTSDKYVWLGLNEYFSFAHADTVYIHAPEDLYHPGRIFIYVPLTAKHLTLEAEEIDFFYAGAIYGQPGGSVALEQLRAAKDSSDYGQNRTLFDDNLLSHIRDKQNIDLTLKSPGKFILSSPLTVEAGKNLTLEGATIRLWEKIAMNGGILTLNYTKTGRNHSSSTIPNFDQAMFDQIKFNGAVNLAVTSRSNLLVSAHMPNLNWAEFGIYNASTLTINTPLTAHQHLKFWSQARSGFINILQPVATDKGAPPVIYETFNNAEDLFIGKAKNDLR